MFPKLLVPRCSMVLTFCGLLFHSAASQNDFVDVLKEIRGKLRRLDNLEKQLDQIAAILEDIRGSLADPKHGARTEDAGDEKGWAPPTRPMTGSPTPDIVAAPKPDGNCVEKTKDGVTCRTCFKDGNPTEICTPFNGNPDRTFKGDEPGGAHFAHGMPASDVRTPSPSVQHGPGNGKRSQSSG